MYHSLLSLTIPSIQAIGKGLEPCEKAKTASLETK